MFHLYFINEAYITVLDSGLFHTPALILEIHYFLEYIVRHVYWLILLKRVFICVINQKKYPLKIYIDSKLL